MTSFRRIGLIADVFDPPTLEDCELIVQAAALVDELHIVVQGPSNDGCQLDVGARQGLMMAVVSRLPVAGTVVQVHTLTGGPRLLFPMAHRQGVTHRFLKASAAPNVQEVGAAPYGICTLVVATQPQALAPVWPLVAAADWRSLASIVPGAVLHGLKTKAETLRAGVPCES